MKTDIENTESAAGADSSPSPGSAFPVNPERDANGNAVLYPGMVRYEGVAAIFGKAGSDEYIVLAPDADALERVLSAHGFTGELNRDLCRIATLERIQRTQTLQLPRVFGHDGASNPRRHCKPGPHRIQS